MPSHTLLVTERVFRVLQGFSPAERREVNRLLGLIQADPWVDNAHKIIFPMPPAVMTAYVARDFWIVYHLSGNLITVYNVKHAAAFEPLPS